MDFTDTDATRTRLQCQHRTVSHDESLVGKKIIAIRCSQIIGLKSTTTHNQPIKSTTAIHIFIMIEASILPLKPLQSGVVVPLLAEVPKYERSPPACILSVPSPANLPVHSE